MSNSEESIPGIKRRRRTGPEAAACSLRWEQHSQREQREGVRLRDSRGRLVKGPEGRGVFRMRQKLKSFEEGNDVIRFTFLNDYSDHFV